MLVPPRGDISDVLVHPGGRKLDDLPPGSRVGTSAPRRIAQLTASHPHLSIQRVRGNADTRLQLASTGQVDAVILADASTLAVLGRLVDPLATRAAVAERTLLRALAGHCHAPIAGYALADQSGMVRLTGRVYAPDGSVVLSSERTGTTPKAVGSDVAGDLIAKGANELLASSRRT